jgi:hypothetical protein
VYAAQRLQSLADVTNINYTLSAADGDPAFTLDAAMKAGQFADFVKEHTLAAGGKPCILTVATDKIAPAPDGRQICSEDVAHLARSMMVYEFNQGFGTCIW